MTARRHPLPWSLAPALVLALAVALAGCGELHSPDLAHGAVIGRVAGASPGAFAYPLGRPDQKVPLASDGSFELGDQPVGGVEVVLYDGSARAELVQVQVGGAARTRIDRSADLMPLASAVAVAALAPGGALPVGARLAMPGTDQAAVIGASGAATLEHLPAGTFSLTARVDGYKLFDHPVTLTAGATQLLEVPLQVEGGSRPGCAANQCRNGLRCSPADGLCYQCLADSDCGAGGSCDPSTRFCRASGGAGPTPVCASCTADTDCGSVGACVKVGTDTTGYCTTQNPVSTGCTDGSFTCPAGFACQTDGSRDVCAPPLGCGELLTEFGERCFGNSTCSGGIAGGVCHGSTEAGQAGRCTAACGGSADCIVAGFTCIGGFCTRLDD